MNDSILVLVGSDLLCINAPVMKLAPTSGDNEKLSWGIKNKKNTLNKKQTNRCARHRIISLESSLSTNAANYSCKMKRENLVKISKTHYFHNCTEIPRHGLCHFHMMKSNSFLPVPLWRSLYSVIGEDLFSWTSRGCSGYWVVSIICAFTWARH